MMIKVLCVVILLAAPVFAVAQECTKIDPPNLRLICYDKLHARVPRTAEPSTPTTEPKDPKPDELAKSSWIDELKLADNIGAAGRKSAAFNYTQDSNSELSFYAIKAAVTWNMRSLPPPEVMREAGWSWYSGISINKTTNTQNPSDYENFAFGANGNLFATSDFAPIGSSLSFAVSRERIENKRALKLSFDNMLLPTTANHLSYGLPNDRLRSFYQILPIMGAYNEYIQTENAGEASGTVRGGYLGAKLTYTPGGALWRLGFDADLIRSRDLAGANGIAKRSSTWKSLTLNIALTDPSQDAGSFEPSLSITRSNGSDYRFGEPDQRSTILAFTLKKAFGRAKN